jgi:hypothetical protein
MIELETKPLFLAAARVLEEMPASAVVSWEQGKRIATAAVGEYLAAATVVSGPEPKLELDREGISRAMRAMGIAPGQESEQRIETACGDILIERDAARKRIAALELECQQSWCSAWDLCEQKLRELGVSVVRIDCDKHGVRLEGRDGPWDIMENAPSLREAVEQLRAKP